MTDSMTKAEKNRLIVALSLAMLLAAIEGTIVTLAIPAIVGDLRGFDLISHVFSVYLLTGALATPVYGKLSDLYGRKRMLIIGIVVFLVGSALCGLARNMAMLIGFRALQGLGAGSVYTVPMVIVGDVFPLHERGKIQGALGMVWGVAGLLGPFLGGLLIDFLSWHWIFFINIPFGILTLFILQTSLHEEVHRQKHHIDYPGILVLTAAMSAFLSIFIFSGEGASVLTFRNAALLVLSLVLLVVFYRIEKRAPEPIVPLGVLTRSSVFVNIVSLLFMATLLGIDVYTALYLQNIKGFSPLVAGLLILPMSITWMLASIPLGRLMLRFGGKPLNAAGIIISLLGLLPFLAFAQDTPAVLIIVMLSVLGVGFGIAMTIQTMVIQESVGFEKRGAAVAVNSLVRTLGQTVGISIFGVLFNTGIIQGFTVKGIAGYDLANLYDLTAYPSDVGWGQIVSVLAGATHGVYAALVAIMVLCIILSFVMPRPPSARQQKGEPH